MLPTTAPGLLELLASRLRASLQTAGHDPTLLDGFFQRQRQALLDLIDELFADDFARLRAQAPAGASPTPPTPPVKGELLGALVSPKARTEANLAALALLASKAPEQMTAEDRAALARYSGWGGLSLNKVADRFPPGLPVPEKRGLIHEYYTPPAIARALVRTLRPLLDALAAERGGRLEGLEPSAGIGRFIEAAEAEGLPVRWTAVEYSAVSAKLLQARWPELTAHAGSLESFVSGRPLDDPRFDLILSNPPYGPRGASASEDHQLQRVKAAYVYFMRRSFGLLRPGGLAAYLVPGGALTGTGKVTTALREELLRRGHLAVAFRLPSEGPDGKEAVFPGANLVTDLLVLRRRAATLAAVLPSDQGILAGGYFREHPVHVLGEEFGDDHGEDDQSKKPRWGYGVRGTFTDFPAWSPRPELEGEADATPAPKGRKADRRGSVVEARATLPDDAPEAAHTAARLGDRVSALLNAITAGDARGAGAWSEVRSDLLAWVEAHGDPLQSAELAPWRQAHVPSVERFLAAFASPGFGQPTRLIEALSQPPQLAGPRYTGARDLLAAADWLYREKAGKLTLRALVDFAELEVGLAVSPLEARAQLQAADWCVEEGAELAGWWHPRTAYLTGPLWPRYDAARLAADHGDAHAARQAAWLLDAIAPATWADLVDTLTPRDAWLPDEVLNAWLRAAPPFIEAPRRVQRDDRGVLLTLRRVKDGSASSWTAPDAVSEAWPYAALPTNTKDAQALGLNDELLDFLGYFNHDPQLWTPRRKKVYNAETGKDELEPLDEVRFRVAAAWAAHFRQWLATDEVAQRAVEESYNRRFKGYIAPTFSTDPLPLARWGERGLRLHPYQNAALRRLAAVRRGLLAFDVGLGKTATGLALIALARQEGWARRPVVVVPNSIVWKWKRDFERNLPDYRVLVVGSQLKTLTRGDRKGVVVAEVDTPEERARKWATFRAGGADVVLLTMSMVGRTRIASSTLTSYAQDISAVRRFMALRREEARQRAEAEAQDATQGRSRRGRSERQEAVEAERGEHWLLTMLQGNAGTDYDPGLTWEEIGCDLLVVDEAQNFKGLFGLEPREGGIPEGIGSTNPSRRAWHLDFRAHAVRQRTGGPGVVLLSATPAKNSPVELYNLLHMVDPAVWEEVGIPDPESFFDHFCQLSSTRALTPEGKVVVKAAVRAFQHLDDLRAILSRYTEFKTAEDVGLRIPEADNFGSRPDELLRPTAEQAAGIAAVVAEIRRLRDELKRLAHSQDAATAARREALNLKIGSLANTVDLISLHPELPGLRTVEDEDLPELRRKRSDTELEQVARAIAVTGRAPKIEALVERIARTVKTTCGDTTDDGCCLSCGHIVFVQNLAVHTWVHDALVKAGLPAERIATLNAFKAPDPETRQQIAEHFNGSGCPGDPEHAPPRYDVILANSVAYEGVDLQRRTCMIHHLDLPYEPASLQQRNGRGVRQGNRFAAVEIHYYLMRRTLDARRLVKISNKAGWLSQLFGSTERTTNNPAARVELSVDEIVYELADDEQKAAIEQDLRVQAMAQEQERLRAQARTGNQWLRQAHDRLRKAERASTPEHAQRYRHEAEALLVKLTQLPNEAWPWAAWLPTLRTQRAHIPELGPPLLEGQRWRVGATTFEVGAVRSHAPVGIRQVGARRLEYIPLIESPFSHALPDLRPELHVGTAATPDAWDAEAAALERELRHATFPHPAWFAAPAALRERFWVQVRETFPVALRSGWWRSRLPLLVAGRLELSTPEADLTPALRQALADALTQGRAEVLPSTPSGAARLPALLPEARTRYKAAELDAVLDPWFGAARPVR